MRFNIIILSPQQDPNYKHNLCFLEVADVLKFSLEDLGHDVLLNSNLIKDGFNIILGYHFLDGKKLPPGYRFIIYQLEELGAEGGWPPHIIETLRSDCFVWDFCEQNIEYLAERGIQAYLKPIGFHPKMERIPHQDNKDIDILFYGSINHRRRKILHHLQKRFNTHILFGLYGKQRDEWIGRSKIVVSIYYYEKKQFDYVRLFYLMNNKVFTIIEDTPHRKYEDFLVYAQYDEIVDTCAYYLENEPLRKAIAEKTYLQFSNYPETEFLSDVLRKMKI
ncbi:MAG: hypothetical protein D6813_01825 [Calditrichaeota bacterium]|nr:MAG: hypothetical protein D6813_01825 [Calditrichota bacterium]